jgi:hypothetical protein
VGRRGEEGRGQGKGGEMTQTLYAHMNKINFKKRICRLACGKRGKKNIKKILIMLTCYVSMNK